MGEAKGRRGVEGEKGRVEHEKGRVEHDSGKIKREELNITQVKYKTEKMLSFLTFETGAFEGQFRTTTITSQYTGPISILILICEQVWRSQVASHHR